MLKKEQMQSLIDYIEFGLYRRAEELVKNYNQEEVQSILDCVPHKKRNDIWKILAIDYGTYPMSFAMPKIEPMDHNVKSNS